MTDIQKHDELAALLRTRATPWTPITAEQVAAMTPAEKRMMIAQDVINKLDAELLIAANRVYLRTTVAINNGRSEMQMCERLEEMPPCEGCALGTMFLACVGLFDDLTVGEFSPRPDSFNMHYDHKLRPHLEQMAEFSMEQMRLIEEGFEGHESIDGPFYAESQAWHYDHSSLTSRMRLTCILRNILAHDGEFVPLDDLCGDTRRRYWDGQFQFQAVEPFPEESEDD